MGLLSFSFHCIDVRVGEMSDPKRWRLTGVYGHPMVDEHRQTWELLRQLRRRSDLPWLLVGDFNEILWGNEKLGGPMRCQRQMDGFRSVVDDLGLSDLGFVGSCFTWRGVRGGEVIKVCLDRGLATQGWCDIFSFSKVCHLPPNKSDHVPVLVKVREACPHRKRKKKCFRFEEMWLREEDCGRVVKQSWDGVADADMFISVCKKIAFTRSSLMEWSMIHFGALKKEIEETREKLAIFFL